MSEKRAADWGGRPTGPRLKGRFPRADIFFSPHFVDDFKRRPSSSPERRRSIQPSHPWRRIPFLTLIWRRKMVVRAYERRPKMTIWTQPRLCDLELPHCFCLDQELAEKSSLFFDCRGMRAAGGSNLRCLGVKEGLQPGPAASLLLGCKERNNHPRSHLQL